MKVVVTKLPDYFNVHTTCIFADKTGEEIAGKDYSTLEHCVCQISGCTCELQAYEECPYLISFKEEMMEVYNEPN
jgi:hypothetical protein